MLPDFIHPWFKDVEMPFGTQSKCHFLDCLSKSGMTSYRAAKSPLNAVVNDFRVTHSLLHRVVFYKLAPFE